MKDLPGWMTVTAAGIGGLMYWVTIYPLDQIKSAMATDSIIVSERKYPTMTVTAQVILTCCWTRCVFRAQRCAASGKM